ncbi:MAG: DegV family protein [Clostridia bacterium]|nr:DegV family protein [Clostridia bacterium]
MDQTYVFMTDSDSDLPFHLKEKYDIPVVYMPYALDGKEYFDDLGQMLDHKSYYDMMRNGAAPVTSALNEAAYIDYFEPILKDGMDLLFVAFSSKLSCTLQAVYSAREKLLAQYPERKFIVVDTLRISGPMTLLVLKAHEMYRAGKSIEEVAAWLEENKLRAQAYFIVDDLKYLKRGGRISATAATVGTMLDLKPIISEAADGTLTANDKIRGRKKAIAFIVDKMLEFAPDPAESPIIVLHADSIEDAERTKSLVEQKLPDANVMIENVGPVIGAHSGPGTIALCFIGSRAQA